MCKKSFFAGILSTVMLFTLIGSAYALSGKKTIEIDYSDIQIELRGEKIIPMDASGNIVEPFAYQGTTYLPVRAVGNALGLEVDWDAENHTVLLENPDNTTTKAFEGFNTLVAQTVSLYSYALSHIPNGVIVDAYNHSGNTLNSAKNATKDILQDIEEIGQMIEELKNTLIASGYTEESFSLYTTYFPKLKNLGNDVESALAMLENDDLSAFMKKDEEIMTAGTELISELTADLLSK